MNATRYYGEITGWGKYAPKQRITNHDLEKRIDTSHEWIVQRTGIHERRVAEEGETTATLAVNASRQALEKSGVAPDKLDLIIVATSSPDYLTPPVSSQVQHMLGATGVPAFVLETGCTGFVYALTTAYQFIATGAYDNILVIGVELITRWLDWEDRATCVLFGDAAGAVVVQKTEGKCGLFGFDLGSDGSQSESIIVPAGGTANPPTQKTLDDGGHFVRMNGQDVFKFATRVIGKSCRRALANANKTMRDVDWIIPHQANLRIIETASRFMETPMDRFIVNVHKYANTSAASIPVALTEALDEGIVSPEDTLLMVSFGAGLTWASAVLQMTPSRSNSN